ncbi:hypothetical protein MUG91_G177n1 [Manis pentadactyla]|nr:hypothetical protein MUG91_G177n1 [Manis pentadactyla]
MRDHRTGHMLPHQKTKPFACMEQGCSTSYCDDLSLHRHYEVEHGLCVLKEATPVEEDCGDSSPAPKVAGQPAADGLRSMVPPETSLEDELPLPPTLLKAPGEASGDPGYAGEEGDTRASKESDSDRDSCSQQHVQEPALQEALKPSWLSSDATPLFRQLFLKSQECLVSQEQVQVFQMIAKSQRIISGPQVAVASSQHAVPEGKQAALKPLQGPRPHQPPPLAPTFDSFHPGPGNPEAEGSPPHKGKTMPAHPREALPGNNTQDTKGGPKMAPAPWQPPGNPDVYTLAKQLGSTKGPLDLGDILPTGSPWQTQLGGDDPAGAQLPGKQAQAESGLASGAMKGAKGLACSRRKGHMLIPGNSQDKRFSDFQKEKLKMDRCCEASPSKVATASFSSAGPLVNRPQDSKSNLMISNRIQGGNTYRLPDPVKEDSMVGRCNQQNGGPADWAEPRSTYVCKNCSQMFHTEEGLTRHMCFPNDDWLSLRGNQDQQVALETNLLSGPQKPPTHPLADYHYAGSAIWTPMEKELFHKAFCVYKRNFSLIQKMVRTKTVAQCVQYYYSWRKRVTFTTSSWAPAVEKRVKRKLAEADPTETKATCSPQKRRHHHPTLELKTETESGRGESVITASPSAAPKRTPEPPGRVQGQGAFPCGECERVFDKMWTRCAHMKRHRLQDPEETAVGEERPAKAFKVEEEEEEEEGEMGADMGPLQG